MNDLFYWILGLSWVLSCLGVGFLVRTGTAGNNKIAFGFAAIILFYLFGIGLLAFALCNV